MIDLTSDGHVHTKLCRHAVGEMEEYVQAAIARGLKELIFLEHLERGISYFERTWLTDEEFAWYRREGERLARVYEDRIRVGLGVEVGYNPQAVPELQDFLAKYQWDRVGLSYHFYEISGHHYNVVSRRNFNLETLGRHGIARVISDYLATLVDGLSRLPQVNVLCHLDAVLRHHPDVLFLASHRSQFTEIFALMREQDVALEVNASGFVHRGEPYPAWDLIREATAAGVRLVAGSDAHNPKDVGRYFQELGRLG